MIVNFKLCIKIPNLPKLFCRGEPVRAILRLVTILVKALLTFVVGSLMVCASSATCHKRILSMVHLIKLYFIQANKKITTGHVNANI